MHFVVCNRCHHAHITVPAVVFFLVIIARISHVCRSATHGHLGEAPLRPSRQNQVYVTASFSAMSCLGRFYVLGPPVQSAHAVEDLVSYVMRETPDLKTANFVLNDIEGPVRYDSTWVPGGRPIVHACGVMDHGQAHGLTAPADGLRSFSVIVLEAQQSTQSTGTSRC